MLPIPIQHPKRGIIVADTNELFDLSVTMPEVRPRSPLAQMSNTTGTYLDLLVMLAKSGYEVVIPATVVYEASTILPLCSADRKYFNMCDIFDGEKSEFRGTEHFKIRNQFLKNVCKHKYKNISVLDLEGREQTLWGQHFKPLIDAVSAAEFCLQKKDLVSAKRVMNKAFDTQRTQQFHRDLGDEEAKDYVVKKLAERNPDQVPIYYLSTDISAKKRMLKELKSLQLPYEKVNVLLYNGLLDALGGKGNYLLRDWGLKGDGVSHCNYVYDKLCTEEYGGILGSKARKISRYDPCDIGIDASLQDAIEYYQAMRELIKEDGATYKPEVKPRPFKQGIEQLRKDYVSAYHQYRNGHMVEQPIDRPLRSARFKQKWGSGNYARSVGAETPDETDLPPR